MQCVNPDVKCDEARCDCGHLVAKLLASGVELKCKRCKRLVIIPYTSEDQGHSPVPSVSRRSK
jgi:phage FluMu protein Com